MRLVHGRPFRHSPESVHQPSRTVGKFVGEPPLRPKRSMRSARKPLEIRHPVVRTKCRLPIRPVSGLRKVQRLYRGESGRMTVATLIGFVAAEINTVSLFGSYGGPMHNVLGPFWRGLDPLDQLLCMFAPLRIFLWMKQNIAGKLQWDYLVHVTHPGSHVFEIPHPDIIRERIFLKPLPGARTYPGITRNVGLP